LILGCTELSLVDEMRELGCPLFDPLAIVAQRAVEIARNWDRGRADLESQQIRTGRSPSSVLLASLAGTPAPQAEACKTRPLEDSQRCGGALPPRAPRPLR
jgi:hypothetical protein